MSVEYANQIISGLPSPISGDGLFDVTVVVPNTDSSFNTPSGTTQSNSYSYPLMSPADLIGTGSNPYMPVGLSAYITTLYDNVYNINTNLKNDISTSAPDDRTYPTSFAVQQYVQSQIAGTQIINSTGPTFPEGIQNTYLVLTTLNNTLITSIPSFAQAYQYTNNDVASPGIKSISIFWMNTAQDTPRVGANKTVMFAASDYLTNDNGITGNLVFLYSGNNSYFVNAGKKYSYYQFVYRGDFVNFIQSYDSSTNSWDWLVTNCMGVFSNSIKISGAGGITYVSGSNQPLPIPDTIQ